MCFVDCLVLSYWQIVHRVRPLMSRLDRWCNQAESWDGTESLSWEWAKPQLQLNQAGIDIKSSERRMERGLWPYLWLPCRLPSYTCRSWIRRSKPNFLHGCQYLFKSDVHAFSCSIKKEVESHCQSMSMGLEKIWTQSKHEPRNSS